MIFLSHSSEDSAAVRELAEALRAAGFEVWLDLERTEPSEGWIGALEEGLRRATGFVVYVGRAGVRTGVGREVRTALDRSAKEPEFRVVPVLGPGADPQALPAFLAQHASIDLRQGPLARDELRRLFERALERRDEARPVLAPDEAPFRGLLIFDVEHSHLFFGRDGETEDLLERLSTDRFLAVVGDSGSGKSSLVRAALIPALHQGRLQDAGSWAPTWRVAVLRPGDRPFRALADGLLDLEPELARPDRAAQRLELRATLTRELAEGVDGLHRIVAAVVPERTRTLIVVDQFEEIFAEGVAAEERQRFIDTLLAAAGSRDDRPIWVALTLRADFYPACLAHPELAERLAANQYVVRRVARDQLRQLIEGPLALAGARAESGLVEVIVHEVGSEPANLALLEHALLQLWETRSGRELTHEGYEAIGRIEGALEHHAEKLFGQLSTPEQAAARRLFLRLTRASKDALDTRRRARLAVLVEAAGTEELVSGVLRRLVAAHLVVGSTAGDSPEPEYEVAHEALIRSWSRLRRWLDEDREFLLWRQRLGEAVKEWERTGRDPEALQRGALLTEAGRWLRERPGDLASGEETFIRAGLEAERTRRRRRRWAVTTALAAVLAVSAVILWLGLRARDSARQVRNQALAMMAGAAEDPGLGALLAAEVDGDTPEAAAARRIRELLARSPRIPRAMLDGFDASIGSVAFVGDCARPPVEAPGGPSPIPRDCRVVTRDALGRGQTTRADGRGQPEPIPSEGAIRAIVPSPDGSRLALLLEDGRVAVRRPGESGEDRGSLADLDPVESLAFRPGGGLLAVSRGGGLVCLGERLETVDCPPANGVAPDARVFASEDAWIVVTGTRARVFGEDGALLGEIEHEHEIQAALPSRDGSRVVTRSDGAAFLWARAGPPRPGRILPSDTRLVEAAAIFPDGSRVVTARADVARLSSVTGASAADDSAELRGHDAPIAAVAVSADGSLVATAAGRAVRVWSTEPLAEPVLLFEQADGPRIRDLDVGRNGAWVVAGSHPPVRIESAPRPLPAPAGLDPVVRVAFLRAAPALIRVTERRVLAESADGSGGCRQVEVETEERITAAAIDAESCRVALAFGRRPIQVRSEQGARMLERQKGEFRSEVASLAVAPDGRVAAGFDDGTVLIWPAAGDAEPQELTSDDERAHDRRVRSVAFHPRETGILTASDDETLLLWSARGRVVHRFSLGDPVRSAEFSPGGNRLLAVADARSGGVSVFEAEGGFRKLDELNAGDDVAVLDASFGAGGERVYTADDRGRILRWRVGLGALQELLRQQTTGCLAKEERERRLGSDREEAAREYEACRQTLVASEAIGR